MKNYSQMSHFSFICVLLILLNVLILTLIIYWMLGKLYCQLNCVILKIVKDKRYLNNVDYISYVAHCWLLIILTKVKIHVYTRLNTCFLKCHLIQLFHFFKGWNKIFSGQSYMRSQRYGFRRIFNLKYNGYFAHIQLFFNQKGDSTVSKAHATCRTCHWGIQHLSFH